MFLGVLSGHGYEKKRQRLEEVNGGVVTLPRNVTYQKTSHILGAGNNGVVYKATSDASDEIFALKEFREGCELQRDAEIKALLDVRGVPYCLQLLEVGPDKKYIVVPLAHGQEYAHWCRCDRSDSVKVDAIPMTDGEFVCSTLLLLITLARLWFFHNRVHGNVRGDNMMFSSETGSLTLIDWGRSNIIGVDRQQSSDNQNPITRWGGRVVNYGVQWDYNRFMCAIVNNLVEEHQKKGKMWGQLAKSLHSEYRKIYKNTYNAIETIPWKKKYTMEEEEEEEEEEEDEQNVLLIDNTYKHVMTKSILSFVHLPFLQLENIRETLSEVMEDKDLVIRAIRAVDIFRREYEDYCIATQSTRCGLAHA